MTAGIAELRRVPAVSGAVLAGILCAIALCRISWADAPAEAGAGTHLRRLRVDYKRGTYYFALPLRPEGGDATAGRVASVFGDALDYLGVWTDVPDGPPTYVEITLPVDDAHDFLIDDTTALCLILNEDVSVEFVGRAWEPKRRFYSVNAYSAISIPTNSRNLRVRDIAGKSRRARITFYGLDGKYRVYMEGDKPSAPVGDQPILPTVVYMVQVTAATDPRVFLGPAWGDVVVE